MLADQITGLRKKAGMSQMQLGEMLHIGPSAVGMYEQGRRTPSIDTIIRLAIVFGVSLDYLITGKEAPRLDTTAKETPPTALHPCRCCLCCRCPQIAHTATAIDRETAG